MFLSFLIVFVALAVQGLKSIILKKIALRLCSNTHLTISFFGSCVKWFKFKCRSVVSTAAHMLLLTCTNIQCFITYFMYREMNDIPEVFTIPPEPKGMPEACPFINLFVTNEIMDIPHTGKKSIFRTQQAIKETIMPFLWSFFLEIWMFLYFIFAIGLF